MKTLAQIKSEPSLYQRTKLLESRQGNGVPSEIEIQEEIGRGSNNRVFKGVHTKSGQTVVIRCPRRKSDTERAGHAAWEFRHTLHASKLGVSPALYDAWYVRHKKPLQKSGLHLISEYFPHDGQEAYAYYTEDILKIKELIEQQLVEHIRKLADSCLFCYDLKPGNLVLDFEYKKVKLIDFGREYCEHNPWDSESTERSPITTYIKHLSKENTTNKDDAKKLYSELLFLTMLILLSSNTSYYLFTIKDKINADKHLRKELNIISDYTKEYIKGIRGNVIGIVRNILRHEEIRSVCRHYMSRRNSGTRRLFQWATCEKS